MVAKKAGARPKREKIQANFEDQERRTGAVDWRDGERRAGAKPIREETWTPPRRTIVEAAIRLDWPQDRVGRLTTRLSLVSVHRPSKAPHLQKIWPPRKAAAQYPLGEVPLGDYVAILRLRGHRPVATLVEVRRAGVALAFSPPLIPVESRLQETELLRAGERHPQAQATRQYLARFGYLDRASCECPAEVLCPHVEAGLRLLQRTYRLEVTGSLTIDALMLMLSPRCAVPDFGLPATPAAASGSAMAGSGPGGTTEQDPIVFSAFHWDTFGLNYRLLDGTSDISNEWTIARKAMQNWADVSPLSFTEVSSAPTDLEFDFRGSGESGYPFDEGGSKSWNVYAHAFFPTNGLVEFDDHEDWGDLSLEAVATHEVGHALGLRHSSVKDASMYANYHSGQKTLKEVDVRGIKSLYAPVVRRSGPFIAYPLFAFGTTKGTDTVTIDLGATRSFLAWGVITMIDALTDFDRDNMCFVDIFEVDGNRTDWRASGGDHFGSASSPANAHEGAFVGRGRTVMFRMVAGHVSDLEVSGYGIVLVLD